MYSTLLGQRTQEEAPALRPRYTHFERKVLTREDHASPDAHQSEVDAIDEDIHSAVHDVIAMIRESQGDRGSD